MIEDKEVLELIGQEEYDKLKRNFEKNRVIAQAIDNKVPYTELMRLMKKNGWRRVTHSIIEPKND